MTTILWKFVNDFRLAKGKLALLLLASALSAWGIGSVVYGYLMTERDFEENFERTHPADIALVVDGYTEELKQALLNDENVVDVERREVVNARIRSKKDSWMPLVIHAVEDVNDMRMDKFELLDEQGRAPGLLLIEQNAWSFLNKDQQSVELQFRGQKEPVTWEVGGSVHDARQAPAVMEGVVYAYATSIDKVRSYIGAGTRRLLVRTNVNAGMDELRQVYARLKRVSERAGGKVGGYSIPVPGEHIHQNLVDNISFLQLSGGAVLAIMGIVLLSLILLTWIYPQINDIGVMKAVGASSRTLFLSYATVLGLIIGAGLMVGMPLGYVTAMLYNKSIAFLQNFDPVKDLLPLHAHLTVILIASAIPLLFGILPLLRASRMSVNDAMTRTFYVAGKRFFRASQVLTSNARVKYVLNNLLRHGQRTLLTTLLLAVGMALFFSASNVEYSVREHLKAFEKTSSYEVLVKLPSSLSAGDVSFVEDIPAVVRAVPIHEHRVSYLFPGMASAETKSVRVLSSEMDLDAQYLLRGRIDKACSDCLYFSGAGMIGHSESLELGQPIQLVDESGSETQYRFSGVFSALATIGAPFLIFDDAATQKFNCLAFQLEPGLSETEVRRASESIEAAFDRHGVRLLSRKSVKRRISMIQAHLEPSVLIIKATGIFTTLLGLIGLVIVLNLTLQERTREIGVMKSLGTSTSRISNLFSQEFVPVTLLAVVLAALIAQPVSETLTSMIANDIIRHRMERLSDLPAYGLSILVIVAVQVLLVSRYARKKVRKQTRELLDHHF